MRNWWLGWATAYLAVWSAMGAEKGEPKKGEEEVKEEPFTVEHVIHPAVAALPTPAMWEGIVANPMAVSARNKSAQEHVLQGIALIQAAWDFEAYRHFCEAARADPDCLMAYWGIALALSAPNNEFFEQRARAIERMLDLIDAEGGTPLERGYGFALGALYTADASFASKAFRQLSETYPNDIQARLLSIYMQRDGYDEAGLANAGQEEALRRMKALRKRVPDNLAVMIFWGMLHAEAPVSAEKLRKEVLPVVRKIVKRVPDLAPYQHHLGHFEWRCGNHALAEAALRRAGSLYEAYMKKNKVSFHGCDGWVRVRLYLATVLYGRGKFDEAMAVATSLAGLQVKERRLGSAGANLVLWEARTLPARLYAARGEKGDLEKAIATFPKEDDPQLFRERTLSLFYLEALRQYIGGRRQIELGDRDKAREFRKALSATGERFLAMQQNAMLSSSISNYVMALRSLEVLTAELRGLIAMGGPETERGAAYNWFQSATDKQRRPPLLMPPSLLYPMEVRLAEYYLQVGDAHKAARSCHEGLSRRPNDLAALERYHTALLKLGRKDDAKLIARQIEIVTGR